MTSGGRVLAALSGQPFDRRPWTALLSLYGARDLDCSLEAYYTDPGLYIKGQETVQQQFAPDILFAPFALSILGEAFGGHLRYLEEQAPNLREPALSSVKELDALQVPDMETHPRLQYIRESLRGLVKNAGDTPVAAIALAPYDLPVMILGIENWLETVLFDRPGTRRMLALTNEFCTRWANALLEDGAACLVFPGPFMSPSIITRGMAESHAGPSLQTFLPRVNGPVIIHHVGGPLLPFLDLFAGLAPNLVGFVIDSRDDCAASRKRIGPVASLFGGIDGPSLHQKSAEAISRRVDDLLSMHQTDRRFILATTGADVPLTTPPENILALQQGVERFGPIN